MTIALRQVEKAFGPHAALAGASLDIAEGELLALLGPSGSGKTTLLRLIAGLEFPDRGQVLIDGADMTRVGPAARRAGFVFQQYALFDHMSVARNVAFGLEVRPRGARPVPAEIDARVAELLRLVELEGLGRRSPRRLSGGQRQRVALARALAVNPRVLLLDEPFGALDATVRKTLRKELRRIHDATGVTTVFVTHDQAEALELADRVAILNAGRIEQVGSAAEVYAQPASAFVCGFIGAANRFEGEVRAGRFRSGLVALPAPDAPAGAAVAFVRPHDFALASRGGLEARVERLVPHGAAVQVEARLADGRAVELAFAPQALKAAGPGAVLRLEARRSYVFENRVPAPQL